MAIGYRSSLDRVRPSSAVTAVDDARAYSVYGQNSYIGKILAVRPVRYAARAKRRL